VAKQMEKYPTLTTQLRQAFLPLSWLHRDLATFKLMALQTNWGALDPLVVLVYANKKITRPNKKSS
jgi:hypothetical protein